MSGERNSIPPEYTVVDLPRIEEGQEPSAMVGDVMALLHHSWVGDGNPDEEEMADIHDVLSGEGATVAVTDVHGVVVATASYKPNTFPWAEPGWAILHGVAVVPEVGGDQTGDTQRDAALYGIEDVARRHGVTRLATETNIDNPDVSDYYRTRGYTLNERSSSGNAELYKDLR